MKRCHGRLHYDRNFQIFIFFILIGHINVNKGVFCLIISYLQIKSYNVLNYNNCSTDVFSFKDRAMFYPYYQSQLTFHFSSNQNYQFGRYTSASQQCNKYTCNLKHMVLADFSNIDVEKLVDAWEEEDLLNVSRKLPQKRCKTQFSQLFGSSLLSSSSKE